jgi:hypothetical protein
MKDALHLVARMGAGAASLLKRLKKDKSPQAMLATIEESLAANRGQRTEVAARVESLFKEIAAKKKTYEAAAPARRKVLEMELRSRLAEYKAAERELGVLLENERVLSSVKGRVHEVMAYNLRGVDEDAIDRLVDEVEDAVARGEAVLDATADLDKAGRRRERETDREALLTELEAFAGRKPVEPADAAKTGKTLDGDLAEFNEDDAKSAEST